MNKFKSILLTVLLTFTLSSCDIAQDSEIIRYDYDEIIDKKIEFKDIFNIDLPYYFIYIYSLHCLHCELIKSDVISYSLSHRVEMRFIEYDTSIPIIDEAGETINCDKLENIGILGTPALLLIESGKVSLNVSGMDIILNVLNEYF